MHLKSSLLFTKRILFSKTSRSGIAAKSLAGSVLCIGISLVPLVAIITVSNGMIKGITERLISLSSSHIEAVTSSKNFSYLEDYCDLAKKTEGVTNAYPVITSSALAMSSQKRCGITLRAVPAGIFEEEGVYKKLFSVHKAQDCPDGSISDFALNPKGVLIGRGISEKLGVRAGDTIRIVTIDEKENPSGFSIVPRVHSYKVCAVVSCGYQELDALWLFMNIEEGKKILKSAQCTSCVMIETEDAFSPELSAVQKKLQGIFGSALRVYRWDQLNRAQYENFSSTKILLVFIQLLIVLVACVNISSALIMLVLERRREIAVLKTLGAGEGGIATVFLTAGLVCAAAGLLVGIPCGLLLSVNINSIIQVSEKILNFLAQGLYFFAKGDIMDFREIHLLDETYYLKEIPVELPFGELFLIGAATLILSLAVSVMPAVKAAKQRPLEVLRVSR